WSPPSRPPTAVQYDDKPHQCVGVSAGEEQLASERAAFLGADPAITGPAVAAALTVRVEPVRLAAQTAEAVPEGSWGLPVHRAGLNWVVGLKWELHRGLGLNGPTSLTAKLSNFSRAQSLPRSFPSMIVDSMCRLT